MSRLQELIAELCPDGVEYKTLGEVCTFNRGQTITKKTSIEGPIPVVSGGTEPAYYVSENNRTGETVTVAGSGAGAGFVSYWNEPIWCGDSFSVDVKEGISITPRFLYAYLKANENYIRNKKQGAGVPHVHGKQLKNMRIPVPPIEVQREIVRILDKYTAAHDELVRKLEEETALREQQLSLVRNQLLTFSERERVKRMALGEVGVFIRGSSFQKKHFVEDGVPCIHYGQVHTKFNIATDEVVSYLDEGFAAKMKRAQPGDLIIATTSEDDDAVGKAVAWVGDTDVVVSNDAYIYRHELDPKYMAYVFASDLFQKPKRQYITGTKVRRLNGQNMSKIVIPVPPVEVQRGIVRILDEYTTAHDELAVRIGVERETREQQTALVRNQLLSFPEKEL